MQALIYVVFNAAVHGECGGRQQQAGGAPLLRSLTALDVVVTPHRLSLAALSITNHILTKAETNLLTNKEIWKNNFFQLFLAANDRTEEANINAEIKFSMKRKKVN